MCGQLSATTPSLEISATASTMIAAPPPQRCDRVCTAPPFFPLALLKVTITARSGAGMRVDLVLNSERDGASATMLNVFPYSKLKAASWKRLLGRLGVSVTGSGGAPTDGRRTGQ
jgi:hypothetical protein